MSQPSNLALYNRVKAEAKRKFKVWPSAYASGWLVKEYKKRGGTYKGKKSPKTEGLRRWFDEKWINVCKLPKKVPCGRPKANLKTWKKKYPYCRPSKRISKNTPKIASDLSKSEIERRCRQKRRTPLKKVTAKPRRKRKSKRRKKIKGGGACGKKKDCLNKVEEFVNALLYFASDYVVTGSVAYMALTDDFRIRANDVDVIIPNALYSVKKGILYLNRRKTPFKTNIEFKSENIDGVPGLPIFYTLPSGQVLEVDLIINKRSRSIPEYEVIDGLHILKAEDLLYQYEDVAEMRDTFGEEGRKFTDVLDLKIQKLKEVTRRKKNRRRAHSPVTCGRPSLTVRSPSPLVISRRLFEIKTPGKNCGCGEFPCKTFGEDDFEDVGGFLDNDFSQ
jgi:hypothetical protein